MITRHKVAQKLVDYLFHRLSLPELVDWAEMSMMEDDFEEKDFDTLIDITSRLGLADVKSFGITWEDCESFMRRLGYKINLTVTEHIAENASI
ncbi:hypothetical protein [Desulfocucumis palustris]|uniref:hypothetical protein n=1 Tax=Desulfocucumis palustris TaxID=1898651 RepID=UPI000CE9C687|nr:hypothetical protein [Desulfocucumis palustris]